jgi:hypothetical protein
MWCKFILLTAALLLPSACAWAQAPPPSPAQRAAMFAEMNRPRPALLFRIEWQQPPYSGTLDDPKRRVTPAALARNPRLQLQLYGSDAHDVTVWSHESRHDLWNGLCTSPVALTVRDRDGWLDLRGLARLRSMIRTNGLHELHPVVKLADGTLLVGSQRFSTEGEYLEEEVDFGAALNPHWFHLDPDKAVVGSELLHPDLSRVDEVGFVDLMPGGGHGIAGSVNVSDMELYASTVPR